NVPSSTSMCHPPPRQLTSASSPEHAAAPLLPPPSQPGREDFAELPGPVNNSYPVGTKLKYSCHPGYVFGSGKSPFVTCLENSTWSSSSFLGRECKSRELENGRVHFTDLRTQIGVKVLVKSGKMRLESLLNFKNTSEWGL
uniref:Sushi domain-containing protein n=1 Tax=Chrysemys picta bellii TaxID=8478 RepID=A0A8C3F7Y3_CHRPI